MKINKKKALISTAIAIAVLIDCFIVALAVSKLIRVNTEILPELPGTAWESNSESVQLYVYSNDDYGSLLRVRIDDKEYSFILRGDYYHIYLYDISSVTPINSETIVGPPVALGDPVEEWSVDYTNKDRFTVEIEKSILFGIGEKFQFCKICDGNMS